MRTETFHRAAPVIATAVAAIVIGSVLLALLLWLGAGVRPMPVAFGRTALGVFGLVLAPISYAAVGAVLAARAPGNPIGWIFLMVAIAVGVMLPVNVLVTTAHEALRQPPAVVVWAAWVRNAVSSSLMVTLLIAAALVFPTGRLPSRRWRPVLAAVLVGGAVIMASTAVDPRGLWSYPSLPNPAAVPYAFEPVVTALRIGGIGILLPCVVLAVVSVSLRYQRGSELVQAQLRWILLAVAVTAISALPWVAARFLFEVDDATGEAASALAQVGACAFPVAAAFAISRYRLFDVDVLIGRTLVYLPLTAILGGLYTAGITLFQRLFVAVTGGSSDVAIVLAILVVATAFTPVRKALESVVDRKFPAAPHHGHHGGGPPAAATPPAPSGGASPALQAHLVSVSESGLVACPLAGQVGVQRCLACPQLAATVNNPTLAVVCRAPLTGAAATGSAPPR
jgi:hypothetical protein